MENKLIKTIKGNDEIRKFYQFPLRGSEKVEMGGKSYYMTIQKLDEYGKPIQHKVKYPKTNIREKQCGNCGKTVGVEYFYTDSYNVSGYSHWCKVCCKKYSEEYLKEKKEEKLKEKKEFEEYQTAKNVEKLINEDYELFLKLIEGKE